MNVRLLDYEPAPSDERAEILAGLHQDQKQLSPKYFYDETGSRLFDEICELPEYYPTRTELGIMRENISAMKNLLGRRASIIEPGSGSSLKTRVLLDHVEEPAAYVPVDLSREHLMKTAGSSPTITRKSRSCRSAPTSHEHLIYPSPVSNLNATWCFSRAQRSVIFRATLR